MITAQRLFLINLWHPIISIHILHTVLHTPPKVLTRRICLPIKSFLIKLMIISFYSHDFIVWFRSDVVRRNQMWITAKGSKQSTSYVKIYGNKVEGVSYSRKYILIFRKRSMVSLCLLVCLLSLAGIITSNEVSNLFPSSKKNK